MTDEHPPQTCERCDDGADVRLTDDGTMLCRRHAIAELTG